MGKGYLGEFEQMVLLAVLQLGDGGYAVAVRQELERRADRRVSRGALYRTVDRLREKGLLEWALEEDAPEHGGHPRRRFHVTPSGIRALQSSRAALFSLWEGLDGVLGEGS